MRPAHQAREVSRDLLYLGAAELDASMRPAHQAREVTALSRDHLQRLVFASMRPAHQAREVKKWSCSPGLGLPGFNEARASSAGSKPACLQPLPQRPGFNEARASSAGSNRSIRAVVRAALTLQ